MVSPLGPLKQARPCPSLAIGLGIWILDLWIPELGQNAFLLFKGTKFVMVHYSSQWEIAIPCLFAKAPAFSIEFLLSVASNPSLSTPITKQTAPSPIYAHQIHLNVERISFFYLNVESNEVMWECFLANICNYCPMKIELASGARYMMGYALLSHFLNPYQNRWRKDLLEKDDWCNLKDCSFRYGGDAGF